MDLVGGSLSLSLRSFIHSFSLLQNIHSPFRYTLVLSCVCALLYISSNSLNISHLLHFCHFFINPFPHCTTKQPQQPKMPSNYTFMNETVFQSQFFDTTTLHTIHSFVLLSPEKLNHNYCTLVILSITTTEDRFINNDSFSCQIIIPHI